MRAVAAGMHDPLGNALVVEVEDLLAEMKVLDQRRSALADLQGVLVVGDRPALCGGQDRFVFVAIWWSSPPSPRTSFWSWIVADLREICRVAFAMWCPSVSGVEPVP